MKCCKWRVCVLRDDGIWYVVHAGLSRSKASAYVWEYMRDGIPAMVRNDKMCMEDME